MISLLLNSGIRVVNAQEFMLKKVPSLYSDKRAFGVGDIVTILLMEFTTGSNESLTDTDLEQGLEFSASGTGVMDFIPGMGSDISTQNEYKSKGGTSWKGSLKGKVSARVIGVMSNGLLQLEGQRTVTVNGEEQITVMSGIVRPRDIKADNTVLSYLVADAAITYRGKGAVEDAAKPGFFTRFINWIF